MFSCSYVVPARQLFPLPEVTKLSSLLSLSCHTVLQPTHHSKLLIKYFCLIVKMVNSLLLGCTVLAPSLAEVCSGHGVFSSSWKMK